MGLTTSHGAVTVHRHGLAELLTRGGALHIERTIAFIDVDTPAITGNQFRSISRHLHF